MCAPFFNVNKNVLIAFSLRDVEQVTLLFLLSQFAFDIIGASFYV